MQLDVAVEIASGHELHNQKAVFVLWKFAVIYGSLSDNILFETRKTNGLYESYSFAEPLCFSPA